MIAPLAFEVKTSSDSIIVKHRNVIEHLSVIKNMAEKNNLMFQ